MKRVLCLILALMMFVSVLPMEVFAAETKYDVWVNGEQFTSAKKTIQCGEGYATLDASKTPYILELHNAQITNYFKLSTGMRKYTYAGIYSAAPDGLTIRLYGNNSVTLPYDRTPGITNRAICSAYYVKIYRGFNSKNQYVYGASLTVDSNYAPDESTGIYADKMIEIAANVEITGYHRAVWAELNVTKNSPFNLTGALTTSAAADKAVTFSSKEGTSTIDGEVVKKLKCFSLEEYPVWVNGERFTNVKETIVCGNGTATLDMTQDPYVLTLNNAQITKTANLSLISDRTDYVSIYMGSLDNTKKKEDFVAKMVLKGKNTVLAPQDTDSILESYYSVEIVGDELDMRTADIVNSMDYGMNVEGKIINSAKLNIDISSGKSLDGIYNKSGIENSGTIAVKTSAPTYCRALSTVGFLKNTGTITTKAECTKRGSESYTYTMQCAGLDNSGTITAKAGYAGSHSFGLSIATSSNESVNTGKITATGGESGYLSYGMDLYSNMHNTLTNKGQIIATAGKAKSASYGIYARGMDVINHGSITASSGESGGTSGGLFISKESKFSFVGDSASLKADSDHYAVQVYGTLEVPSSLVLKGSPERTTDDAKLALAEIYASAYTVRTIGNTPMNCKKVIVDKTHPASAFYMITYRANGYEWKTQIKQQDVQAVILSETPTNDGYTFAGWNTSSDGKGTKYAAGSKYTVNADVTLYAQWTKNTTTTTTKTTTKPTTTTTKTTTKPTTTKSTTKPTTTKTTTKPTTTKSTTKPTTTKTTTKPTTTKSTTKPTTTTTKPTSPTGGVQLKRLAGEGRQQTAALISKEAYTTAENVFIASGDNAADALAGVPLAYAMNAPILLIRPGTGLDNDTKGEIQRLKAKNVYILGGEGAIPAKVEKDIQKLGCTTKRIAGDDRFATAVEIANQLKKLKGNPTEVFFVYSHNYPDALAVSGVAAVKGAPILYVYGDGDLRASAEFMKSTKTVKQAYIIGGYGAIKEAADTNVKAYAPVKRVYGDNRYLTCGEINKTFASVLTGKSVCIATGKNFPDALAGGVLAAKTKSPMLLVGDSLLDYQSAYIKAKKPSTLYIFGGTGAVSDAIANDAVKAAK